MTLEHASYTAVTYSTLAPPSNTPSHTHPHLQRTLSYILLRTTLSYILIHPLTPSHPLLHHPLLHPLTPSHTLPPQAYEKCTRNTMRDNAHKG